MRLSFELKFIIGLYYL